MKIWRESFLFCVLVLLMSTSMVHADKNASPQPETWVTVFVHGIMSIQPHVNFSNMVRLLRDQIDGTLYADTIEIMRDNPFFHMNQAMQTRGLQKIDTESRVRGNASGAVGIMMNHMEYKAGIINRDNHYYTFGWSGLLSYSNRYRDAIRFFHDLELLIREYSSKGIQPKIRVVGYSHGGNVCLSLALAQEQHFRKSKLTINELILISTPVQRETDYLINSPLFQHVYHLYSPKDRIQTLDFFNQNRFFSQSRFKQRKGFTLPDKLTQVELRVTRNRKGVCEGTSAFEQTKQFDQKLIMLGKSNLLRDISPGHGEVWFFGWTPKHYRKQYPLYPFPLFTLIPFIQEHLKRTDTPIAPSTLLVADVRPEHGVVLFKRRSGSKTQLCEVTEFMNPYEVHTFSKEILAFKPLHYNVAAYNNQIQNAKELAQKRHHLRRHTMEHAHHHCQVCAEFNTIE